MCICFPACIKVLSLFIVLLKIRLITALELTDLPCTIKMLPSAKNGYLCAKAENKYATVSHFTIPFSPLLSRWLVKEKKSMPTSNHMCNKWCWLCSCGVTTDGVVIVLPQSACAHFRHTLHTAPMGTFSTNHVTAYCQGNYPKDQ